MPKGQNEIPSYTLILHGPRKKMGLTMAEYAIAEAVYHLQHNPVVSGWCFASRTKLADIIGQSRRAVFNMIDKLVEKGLLDRQEETGYLRTTATWYKEVVVFREKTTKSTGGAKIAPVVQSEVVQNVPKGGAKTAPYSNTYSNKNTLEFSFKGEELAKEVVKWLKKDINQPKDGLRKTDKELKAMVMNCIKAYGDEVINEIFIRRSMGDDPNTYAFWQDIKRLKAIKQADAARLATNRKKEEMLSRKP